MINSRFEDSDIYVKRWESAHTAMKTERDLWKNKYLQSVADAQRYKEKSDVLEARLTALLVAVQAQECVYCAGTGLMASLTTSFDGTEVGEDLSCPVCDGTGYKLKE